MSAFFRIWIIWAAMPIVSWSQSKPQVVATASMLADMTEQIAGDRVEVQCIVPIGGDPHVYEPTPGDARMVANADLILRNGLTFEGWLNELIENSGTQAQVVTVTKGITPIASKAYANATDPHAWMDAEKGQVYLDNILESLLQLLPADSSILAGNHAKYSQELKQVDDYISKQIETIPEERRVLITSHDAFQYYGRRYGLQLESALGTSTDADVQTSDIKRLNRVIKEFRIPAVFVESTINPKLLQQLAHDNNIKIGGKLYADSLGDRDSPASTYLAMLQHNTDVIVSALTRTLPDETEGGGMARSDWYQYLLLGALLVMITLFVYWKFAR